jgi:hypothetical protein
MAKAQLNQHPRGVGTTRFGAMDLALPWAAKITRHAHALIPRPCIALWQGGTECALNQGGFGWRVVCRSRAVLYACITSDELTALYACITVWRCVLSGGCMGLLSGYQCAGGIDAIGCMRRAQPRARRGGYSIL